MFTRGYTTNAFSMQESCESSGLHILAEDAKIRLSSEQEVETRCRRLSRICGKSESFGSCDQAVTVLRSCIRWERSGFCSGLGISWDALQSSCQVCCQWCQWCKCWYLWEASMRMQMMRQLQSSSIIQYQDYQDPGHLGFIENGWKYHFIVIVDSTWFTHADLEWFYP